MRRLLLSGATAFSAIIGLVSPGPAEAWERGDVRNFAAIPTFAPSGPGAACPNEAKACSSDVEGVTVAPDGTVYSASYGYNRHGALGGYGEFFVFAPDGRLTKHFPVVGSSPHLIGLEYQQSSKSVLIADLGKGVVWKVDPETQTTSLFMQAPTITKSPGLNALTFDKAGNVYVSDSFQGVIWKTGPNGGPPTMFVDSQTLSPEAAPGVTLIPPFGANGVEFNNEYTEMYVANTAYHSIVEVPVTLNHGSVSVAGKAMVLTTGINAPDGIAVDSHDNLWVDANQQDEIDVINPNVVTSQGPLAKVIAKRGDFQGLSEDATVQGLLFPASPAFSPDGIYIYTSNLALFLPFAGAPEPAIDSPWTLQVKHYKIAKIRAEIPPLTEQDEK